MSTVVQVIFPKVDDNRAVDIPKVFIYVYIILSYYIIYVFVLYFLLFA
jgi:hypothetical protein